MICYGIMIATFMFEWKHQTFSLREWKDRKWGENHLTKKSYIELLQLAYIKKEE